MSIPHATAPAITRLRLVLLLIGILELLVYAGSGAAEEEVPLVSVASIDGPITPVMARYVERAIGDAVDDGATAIVIELDTPGGLSSAMDDIDQDILESEIPVIVYVSPTGARAASAGVFIVYASHVAAMAPGTNIGSASPVSSDGSDIGETMQAKVENDAVARIVNLANLRDRNAVWAEQAVREAANITADEALALDVIDLIATDLPSLLTQIDGSTVTLASGPVTLNTAGAETTASSMNFFEKVLQMITDPTVAYLLMSIGMLGIFFELSNPGAIIPGVVGVAGIVLGLFGLGTLPVNWTGALLILLAFILFIVDLYVPSLGGLTVAGLVSFVFGSYMLLDSNGPPGTQISQSAIWLMAGLLLLLFASIGYLVIRARRLHPATGIEGLPGSVGMVRQALEPDGTVFVFGELWQASLDSDSRRVAVPAGDAVLVTRVDGLRLLVRPASDEEREAGASVVVAPA